MPLKNSKCVTAVGMANIKCCRNVVCSDQLGFKFRFTVSTGSTLCYTRHTETNLMLLIRQILLP